MSLVRSSIGIINLCIASIVLLFAIKGLSQKQGI